MVRADSGQLYHQERWLLRDVELLYDYQNSCDEVGLRLHGTKAKEDTRQRQHELKLKI